MTSFFARESMYEQGWDQQKRIVTPIKANSPQNTQARNQNRSQ